MKALKSLMWALLCCACVGQVSDHRTELGREDGGGDAGFDDTEADAGNSGVDADAAVGVDAGGASDGGLVAPAVWLVANTQAVHPGGDVTLTWSSTNVTSCQTSWGAGGVNGELQVTGLTSDTTYRVSCVGDFGPASAELTIEVGADINEPGRIGAFSIHHDVGRIESSNTPLSLAYLNAVPDGGLPRLFNVNGHLVGTAGRVRLFGVNMPLASAMVTKAEAEAIVANLSKQGFNAVRLISLESARYSDSFTTTYRQQGFMTPTGIDPVALDRLDSFVHVAEQHGLYLQVVLSQGRAHYGYDNCRPLNICRGIDMYLPRLIQVQKDYAMTLLNHVNPYSGRAYKADPGIVAFEINNENGLTFVWHQNTFDGYADVPALNDEFIVPLEALWRQWSQTRYGTASAAGTAWGTSLTAFSELHFVRLRDARTVSAPLLKDWYQFMGEVEQAYLEDMYAFLKQNVGVTSLVYGSQFGYSAPWVRTAMDATDFHDYFGAESLARIDPLTDAGVFNVNGRPVLVSDNRTILQVLKPAAEDSIGLSEAKSLTRPNFYTEFAYYNGNQHMAEMDPVVAAYAGFQDLDAIYQFNYHGMNSYSARNTYPGYYNMTVQALTRFCAALAFRRGDVSPGTPRVLKQTKDAFLANSVRVLQSSTRASLDVSNFDLGGNARAKFTNNIYTEVVSTPAEAQVVSDGCKSDPCVYQTTTHEVTWSPGLGVNSTFTVDTPRTKIAIGYFNERVVPFGPNMQIKVGDTMNDYAVVALSSVDGAPLPSRRMVLTLAGLYSEPGEWPRTAGASDWSWGDDAQRIEAVPALMHLPAGNYQVWALDPAGAKAIHVPVVTTASGSEFVTGPRYDTGWYLIESQ